MRLYWLLGALVLSFALASLQIWALENFLYWRFAWFDVPMHMLGGAAIATSLIAFLKERKEKELWILFALALIGWQVFEYVFGFPKEANYALDTTIDLVVGTLGGYAAYLVARRSLWR